jgi:hypothetical protein
MMIVWELQTASDFVVQGLTTRKILSVIGYVRQMFEDLTSDYGPVEMDAYSEFATRLKLGLGIARGHAWRLDFGRHIPPDYAGSIVNLAARLQALARPEGIVAQLGFSESRFRDRAASGDGKILTVAAPKGFGGDAVDVWVSKEVVIPDELIVRSGTA